MTSSHMVTQVEPRLFGGLTPVAEPRTVEGSSHLLDWYMGRIRSIVEKQGLTSLRWVTGVNTLEVGDRLLESVTGGDLESVTDIRSEQGPEHPEHPEHSGRQGASPQFHIVAAPGDAERIEPLATLSGSRVSRLRDEYPDSFLIVNGTACLDLTPVRGDGGPPEYTDDPTVVDLYMGLFGVIANTA